MNITSIEEVSMTNGQDHYTEILNGAIDQITKEVLDQLSTIAQRVINLKRVIEAKAELEKRCHIELMALINQASAQAEEMCENLNSIEKNVQNNIPADVRMDEPVR